MLTRTKTRILFGSALLLFCLSGAGAVVAISRMREAEKWVTHTRDVQVALARVNTLIARAGRTRTAYVDSGDPNLLREHQNTVAQIPQALATVRALTLDNPAQQASCDELQKLSDQRVQLMAESIALKQSGQSTLEAQTAVTQSTVALATRIDSILQGMGDHEQQLLEQRIERRRNREFFAAMFLGSAFLIAGVLFVVDFRFLNQELAARLNAQKSLQLLSARVLTIRDEERRRFSRELHDSMGQHLASAKMHLDLLGQSLPGNAAIFECSDLLDKALSETRTLSYLLHPPLLDEAGLESAVREYVDGFSKRSGIPVTLRMPEPIDPLGQTIELALFRVLQEGLTNIHKHSGSTQAIITFALSRTQVVLNIRDNGKGIAPEVLEGFHSDGAHIGVGLAGMRERIRQFGGQLKIESDPSGTALTASLPRPKKDSLKPQTAAPDSPEPFRPLPPV
jgi:signal transduction histidine kinase